MLHLLLAHSRQVGEVSAWGGQAAVAGSRGSLPRRPAAAACYTLRHLAAAGPLPCLPYPIKRHPDSA